MTDIPARNDVAVRSATLADVPVIARHRAEMFKDMGDLPSELYQSMIDQTRPVLEAALVAGEYVGFLAYLPHDVNDVVAGAGVQMRRVQPHPLRKPRIESRIAAGRQGLVVNVFTEQAWRRKGVAELLILHVLDYARTNNLDTVVLHASPDGKKLYERLGFAPTNEMRYSGV